MYFGHRHKRLDPFGLLHEVIGRRAAVDCVDPDHAHAGRFDGYEVEFGGACGGGGGGLVACDAFVDFEAVGDLIWWGHQFGSVGCLDCDVCGVAGRDVAGEQEVGWLGTGLFALFAQVLVQFS